MSVNKEVVYQTVTGKLDAYNMLQFRYRSLFVTIIAAYAAITPFLYNSISHVEMTITVIGLLTICTLFALCMTAFFDYITQELTESTVQSCEELEQELQDEGIKAKLPFELKKRRVGAFRVNLTVITFYSVSIGILLFAFLTVSMAVTAPVPPVTLTKFIDVYCFEKLMGNGDVNFMESRIVDCKNRIGFVGFSETMVSFFVILQYVSYAIVTVFAVVSMWRLLSFTPIFTLVCKTIFKRNAQASDSEAV